MEHHILDPYPIPKDKGALFINEPWLVDKSLTGSYTETAPEKKNDNVRIYVPIDLNKEAILRRLDRIIYHYGEADEKNEFEFGTDVGLLISQIEIYDEVWSVRHMPEESEHSVEAKELVREFIARLEDIPDGCAECFPFETIEELSEEDLGR